MNDECSFVRSLRLFSDGREIGQSCRMRLSLTETVSLLPQLYSLEIENLSASSETLLTASSSLEVRSGDSVLVAGALLSACPRNRSGRRILSVSFSPGMALWQSAISLSLTGGLRVSDTLRAVLAASGTGIPLATFLAEERVFSRSQAFFGRTCDALRLLADSVGAMAWLATAGLCAVNPALQSPTLFLPESSLRADPIFLPDRYLLSVQAAGWPLGASLQFTWQGRTYQGMLSRRLLNLDNADGPWQSQLEVVPYDK